LIIILKTLETDCLIAHVCKIFIQWTDENIGWFDFKNEQKVLGRISRLSSFSTLRTSQKTMRPTILLMFRVYSLSRQCFYRAAS
jgi:hypothetical protein